MPVTEFDRILELEAENERLRAKLARAETTLRLARHALLKGRDDTRPLAVKAIDAYFEKEKHPESHTVQSGQDEFGKTGRNEPEKP